MQEPAAQTSDGHRTLEQRAPERGRNRFERPKVAVDTVIFVIDEGRLKTYLVQLKGGPLRGKWAFPGGLVRVGELLDDAANRELASTTGLTCAYLEQLFTFGDPSRDPRSHVVSVAYMALDFRSGPDRRRRRASMRLVAGLRSPVQLPPLAYDHIQMANYALSRLKAKLEYTNIAAFLLPKSFTFKELEDVYGAILGRSLDRQQFPPPDIFDGSAQETAGGAPRSPSSCGAVQFSKI